MATVRSIVLWLVVALLVALAGAQFVRPERINPPSNPADAMTAHVTLPPEVGRILDRSCRDCHSHQTVWPWYSGVAPVSWLVAHDVEEGREHLNFSTWADLSALDQRESLKDICKEVRRGSMPIKAYLIVHREAALSPADVEALCAWTETARAAMRSAN